MNTEIQSTLFQEDFLANLSPLPGNNEARKMTATSGLKCYELLERLNRKSLLAKTLLESLTWHSTRCFLTWRVKATKQRRLLFQLVPSTPLTDEIECGLLPTPNTGGMDGGSNRRKANKKRLNLMKTPTAFDATVKSGKANPKFGDSGSLAQEIMSGFIANRLLPTPKAQDSRCAKTDRGKSNYGEVLHGIYGRNGQLNPRFVEWTMGYPTGWTELKHSETP
jgi:hypothetical protein